MSGLVLGSSANAMQIEICSPSGVQLITIDPNTGEPSEPTAKGGGCDWCQSFGHFIDTSARDDLNWVVLNLSYQQNLALAPPLHKPLRLIADYHSGDISTGGRSMLKVTVTHEEIASPAIGTVAQDIQAQTAALWAQWNKILADNKPVLVPDTNTLEDTIPSLYLFVAKQHGVKSVYLFPMFTPAGVLDGVGVLEYCNETKELSPDELRMVGARFSAIEGLLMSAKHD